MQNYKKLSRFFHQICLKNLKKSGLFSSDLLTTFKFKSFVDKICPFVDKNLLFFDTSEKSIKIIWLFAHLIVPLRTCYHGRLTGGARSDVSLTTFYAHTLYTTTKNGTQSLRIECQSILSPRDLSLWVT